MSGAPAAAPIPVRRGLDRLAPWMLFLLAAAPRLIALERRPLHHDEGSNAIFILRLAREGVYSYDPTNFHGPLFFYLEALSIRALGASTTALRLAPALLGAAMAPLVWCLRREIGRAGAAAAAVLVAVSPAFVYYARDAIHETCFAALTLIAVVGIARAAAPSGGRSWILAAGAAAGALVATKETALPTLGCLAMAALLSWRPPARPALARLAPAALIALLVAGAFYSHLYTQPRALLDPLLALRVWGRRVLEASGHEKAWWYYLMVLGRDDGAALLGGLAGIVVALRGRARFARFLAAWCAGILAAYSAIPYKTPWLILNPLLPLGLLAGVAFEAGVDPRRRPGARAAAVVLLGAAAAGSLARAVDLAFVRYDDPAASPLVYVQTRREALRLVRRLEDLARGDPRGRSVRIEILSPDYLPLNWYLRDFDDVAYFGKMIDRPEAPIVIARSEDAEALATLLGEGFSREEYDLRPGVRLVLFARALAARGGPP